MKTEQNYLDDASCARDHCLLRGILLQFCTSNHHCHPEWYICELLLRLPRHCPPACLYPVEGSSCHHLPSGKPLFLRFEWATQGQRGPACELDGQEGVVQGHPPEFP